jgi:hypothetical protein
MKCWGGENSNGELGDGTFTQPLGPVDVLTISGATAISAGYAQTCAVVSQGAVLCWGNAPLATEPTLPRPVPSLVSGL